jgi:V8-like Glu-specific endopeptidase
MGLEKNGSTVLEEPPVTRAFDEPDDIMSSGAVAVAKPTAPPRAARPRPTAPAEYAVNEVAGDLIAAPGMPGVETTPENAHDEVVSPLATESAEEFIEASPSQLAAESGEESAISDLIGIEGFEMPDPATESAAAEAAGPLKDAGAAADGRQEEFLPVLTALAPALVSTIGPAVARGVLNRLSPRAKRVLKRLPRASVPGGTIGTVAKAAAGALKGGSASTVLGVVARLLETAQQTPVETYEGAVEVDEAFVEEAAQILEVIIGTDDRVRITRTTEIPWRRICALRITFPNGATFRGTGFLIGPRAVATAGHCVYLHNQGGWARKIEVIPGSNGSVRPFGQSVATSFRSVSGWVVNRRPESDYGCIVLNAGAFGGRNLGSFGFAAFGAAALVAQAGVVAGFPGDKPFAELWGMARKFKTVTASTLIYDIDTMGGQSGAPVYIKRNGQRYVVGIHNYGAATGNSATRVTQPVYQRLLAWSRI